MLDPKNLTKEQRRCSYDRFTGTLFAMAPWLGIWFDDAEIKYIETKMMTHKLYRLVNGNVAGVHCRNPKLFDFQREWLLGFMDDPEVPVGVRAFVYYYIGHEQACMKIDDKFAGTQKYETSISHTFLAQRWMEICR